MIFVGCSSQGLRQGITEAGDLIDVPTRVKKYYLGVGPDQVDSRRLWVDAQLTDAERVLFLRNAFKGLSFSTVDYEIIHHDVGRDLLHGYALREKILLKNAIAVETDLHGLGRAIQRDFMPTGFYQCISLFDQTVWLSVHHRDVLYFYIKKNYMVEKQSVFAIRQAMACYNASQPVSITHCYFVNFTRKKAADVCGAILFDAPLTQVNGREGLLIAYGLACRGLCD